MKKIVLASSICCGVALLSVADTIDVPAETTVKLESGKDYSATTFTMSGGTLDQNGVTTSVGGLLFSGSGMSTLTNGDETATVTYAGGIGVNETENEGAARDVHIAGGRHIFTSGYLNLAQYSANPVTFDISGEDTLLSVSRRSGNWYLADQGKLTMNIRGGTLELLGNFGQWVASSPTSTVDINVSGGTFLAKDALNCCSGEININVSGGTFAPSYLRMGNRSSSYTTAQAHTLTMTGGLLDIESEFKAPYDATTYSTCTVNLNGGVAKVPYIRATATPNASSVFSADGGTILARKVQEDLLSGFTTAKLGEQGLVIDTAYAVTVVQSFTGLTEGASFGRLAKKGAGKLTLTGTLADNIRVEGLEGVVTLNSTLGAGGALKVNGGEIVISPTATIPASMTASVTDGTLRIQKDVTLAGLYVDKETRGNVILENGATLTVTKDGETGGITGSLFYCTDDFVTTTDADGTVHLSKDSSSAKTLEIRLDEQNATSNVTEGVFYKATDTLTTVVASGSTLTLEDKVGRGELVKEGPGTLSLIGEDNYFAAGVTMKEGRLVAGSPMSIIGSQIVQQGGTIDIDADSPTKMATYKIETPSSNQAVVFKTKSDITFTDFNHVQGDFIKRGAGTLTIDRGGEKTTDTYLSRDVGVNAQSFTPITFDDVNGVPPTTGFGGFNVAEGRCVLANGQYFFYGPTAMIGMPMTRELAEPVSLLITNSIIRTSASGELRFYIASGLTEADYGQEVSVGVVDSTLHGNSPLVVGGYGLKGASTSPNMRVNLGITNSTVNADWTVCLNENVSGGKTVMTAKDSNFNVSAGFRTSGDCDVTLDNCVYAKNSNHDLCSAPFPQNSTAYPSVTRFTNGSQAYIGLFCGDGGLFKGEVQFDGAAWYAGTGAKMYWDLRDSYPITYFVKTVGAGVTIPVSEGVVNQQTVRIEGEGGLVKTGSGELFFDVRTKYKKVKDAADDVHVCADEDGTSTWDFTGPVDIREGTLSVTNGALNAGVVPKVKIANGATWRMLGDLSITGATVSGWGSVVGGSLVNPTIAGVWTTEGVGAAGGAPTFSETTVSGVVTVDFGRSAENPFVSPYPKNVAVAKGLDLERVSLKAVGLDGIVNARFRVAENGDVECDLVPAGFTVIIR